MRKPVPCSSVPGDPPRLTRPAPPACAETRPDGDRHPRGVARRDTRALSRTDNDIGARHAQLPPNYRHFTADFLTSADLPSNDSPGIARGGRVAGRGRVAVPPVQRQIARPAEGGSAKYAEFRREFGEAASRMSLADCANRAWYSRDQGRRRLAPGPLAVLDGPPLGAFLAKNIEVPPWKDPYGAPAAQRGREVAAEVGAVRAWLPSRRGPTPSLTRSNEIPLSSETDAGGRAGPFRRPTRTTGNRPAPALEGLPAQVGRAARRHGTQHGRPRVSSR